MKYKKLEEEEMMVEDEEETEVLSKRTVVTQEAESYTEGAELL